MMRSLYRPGLRNAFHACNTSACSLRASLMQHPMLCAAGLPGPPLEPIRHSMHSGAAASATARASSGPMADLQGSGACLRFADSASSSHPSSERHSASSNVHFCTQPTPSEGAVGLHVSVTSQRWTPPKCCTSHRPSLCLQVLSSGNAAPPPYPASSALSVPSGAARTPATLATPHALPGRQLYEGGALQAPGRLHHS